MLEATGDVAGNIAVSAGPDGILMVDTQYAPLGRLIQAELKKISQGDVRYVINTHGHVIRGENFYRGGRTTAIYEEGVVNNITTFYRNISEGDFSNPTVPPSVQSNLITILGRKAAYENRLVTWDELVKDEQRFVPKLTGLKN